MAAPHNRVRCRNGHLRTADNISEPDEHGNVRCLDCREQHRITDGSKERRALYMRRYRALRSSA